MTVRLNSDEYFIGKLKYETCIYIVGGIGAISHVVASIVILGHLAGLGDWITEPGLQYYGTVSSTIGITLLMGSLISEIFLMRAVQQRRLPYIQWWIFSSLILLFFSALMTVIIGFTLRRNALWITYSFLYVVIRLPFQMHFVDMFTQVEIMQKSAHQGCMYASVLYNRFR